MGLFLKCTPNVFFRNKLKSRCLSTKVSYDYLLFLYYVYNCNYHLLKELQMLFFEQMKYKVQYQKHKGLRFGNKFTYVEEQKLW